jgi:hypothetical protein
MLVTVQVPEQLHDKFMQRARERFGEGKNSEKALEEAIALWLEATDKDDTNALLIKAERKLNNEAYQRLKSELEQKYLGKYVVIAWGELQGTGDTLAQVAPLAATAKHRLVFKVGETRPKRTERLWRMQKR